MDVAMFNSQMGSDRFRDFGAWLAQEVGYRKASLNIHRYLNFFLALEKNELEAPTNIALAQLGHKSLRSNHLPIRYLATLGIRISAQDKADASEKGQIVVILQSIKSDHQAYELLQSYKKHLDDKHQTNSCSLRSVRLALRAAVGLLHARSADDQLMPEQNDIRRYLANYPGQRAAVYGFITFLRTHGADLFVPPPGTKTKKVNRKKLGAEISFLFESTDVNTHPTAPIIKALTYFHGVPEKRLKSRADLSIQSDPNSSGVFVKINGNRYWLPSDFRKYELPDGSNAFKLSS